MDFSAISEYVHLKEAPSLEAANEAYFDAPPLKAPDEVCFDVPPLKAPDEVCFDAPPIVETLTDGTPIYQAKPIAPPPRLKSVSAGSLMVKDFETLRMPVEGLIVEGLTLLCGASKIGKSWLVLQMCCAVATGSDFLGLRTQQGSVLYLALEDSERRLQLRLRQLGETRLNLQHLHLATRCSTLNEGLTDDLEAKIAEIENLNLIVIDTLQKVRGCAGGNQNAYTADYATMASLKSFADKHHVALVLVHHLNKMKDAADPYDRINGSNALMGAADTTLLFTRPRDSNDATVSFTGRDVWGDDLFLHRDGVRWCAVGKEARERETYEHDPIVLTCRELLDEGFGGAILKMALDDFRKTVLQRRNVHVAETNTALNRRLRELSPLLEKYDTIQLFLDKRVESKKGFWLARGKA